MITQADREAIEAEIEKLRKLRGKRSITAKEYEDRLQRVDTGLEDQLAKSERPAPGAVREKVREELTGRGVRAEPRDLTVTDPMKTTEVSPELQAKTDRLRQRGEAPTPSNTWMRPL